MATIAEALAIAFEHHRAGRLELAGEIYQRLLAVEPNHAQTLHLLGLMAHQQGEHQAAIAHICRAIALDGRQPNFHNNLGEAHRALGNLEQAMASYRRALELDPNLPQTYNNIGEVHRIRGESEKAIGCYRRSLELDADLAAAHNNLGLVLHDRRRAGEAVACYRRAVELEPGFVQAYNNLAAALVDLERLDEAAECCRRALQLDPRFAVAHNTLARVWEVQGNVGQAAKCYRRAVELDPQLYQSHSNYLCLLRYQPDTTATELKAAHLEFHRQHAAGLQATWSPHENSPDAERPLRLGFISPSFSWPVGALLIGALEHLPPAGHEITLYSDRSLPGDHLTARFKAAAARWRESHGWPDAELSQRVRDDRIDILFDLAGHTPGNRLLVFARKPAPIQVTWIDSSGTTGLSAMDYLLADRHLIPPGSEAHYTERVLRLPAGHVGYDPPRGAPRVGPLPAVARGQITFGSASRPAKIGRAVVSLWARILRRVPGSRLLLRHHGWDDRGMQQRFRRLFGEHGVGAERLAFDGYSTAEAYLQGYQQTDVTLDPFPHGGSLTTCDSLWMGVPVITCPGELFTSRQSLAHLQNVGLGEIIAADVDQYEELAVGLARDLPRLAAIRAGLRDRVARSPLCDGRRFAGNLMQLLRQVWREWCRKRRPE